MSVNRKAPHSYTALIHRTRDSLRTLGSFREFVPDGPIVLYRPCKKRFPKTP